jgi:hypothetical protein
MHDPTTTQCVLFADVLQKPLCVRFDDEASSSDGGAVLLKAVEGKLDLVGKLADCLIDDRESSKVRHSLEDLLAQRTYALCCGYSDCNDAGKLASDPILKLLLDRDPITGEDLASQPTLSRFENSVGPRELYRMGVALTDRVVERHRGRLGRQARLVTIDLDPTDDPTHGGQQLSLFNGHYRTSCYLPIAGFLTFNDEPESYLFTTLLRPGNAPVMLGTIGVLWRIIPRLWKAFPRAKIRVRLDGGFANPELLEFLDGLGVEYVVAMQRNAVLKRFSEPLMRKARARSRQSEQTEHFYGEHDYKAKSWSYERRVIFKAEVTRHPGRDPRDNSRFVITNMKQGPRWIYEKIYCWRGEIENRIKELHHGLEIGRTSCTRFWANQFRVLMTSAAFVLMQELRLWAAKTSCGRAQVSTLRERLLKLAARVVVSTRRIVLHLPASCPHSSQWLRIARSLGAAYG